MKLLLDTCTFLWWVTSDPILPPSALGHLKDPQNELFFSAASIAEMAIKIRLGKLRLDEPLELLLPRTMTEADMRQLPLRIDHTPDQAKLDYHGVNVGRQRVRIAMGDFILGILMLLGGGILVVAPAWFVAAQMGPGISFSVEPALWIIAAIVAVAGCAATYVGAVMIQRKRDVSIHHTICTTSSYNGEDNQRTGANECLRCK